jgi:hypothetical protein
MRLARLARSVLAERAGGRALATDTLERAVEST